MSSVEEKIIYEKEIEGKSSKKLAIICFVIAIILPFAALIVALAVVGRASWMFEGIAHGYPYYLFYIFSILFLILGILFLRRNVAYAKITVTNKRVIFLSKNSKNADKKQERIVFIPVDKIDSVQMSIQEGITIRSNTEKIIVGYDGGLYNAIVSVI